MTSNAYARRGPERPRVDIHIYIYIYICVYALDAVTRGDAARRQREALADPLAVAISACLQRKKLAKLKRYKMIRRNKMSIYMCIYIYIYIYMYIHMCVYV